MSAFIRRQPVRTVDLGTRPGLHGQVLISSGIAGIDKLLGGGLPLGSLLLIIEDNHSQQHLNLLKCFMAEGVCCKHSVAWLTAQQLSTEDVAAFLPDQAKSSSSSSSGGGQPATSSSSTTASQAGASTPSTTAAATDDDGLKIAWQYRKYIQNQQRTEASAGHSQQPERSRTSSSSSSSSAAAAVAAGISRQWCHQYDLSKNLTTDQIKASKLELHCCCAQQQQQGQLQQQQQHEQRSPYAAVEAASATASGFLARFQPKGPIPVPSRDPASIGRLVVQSLGGPEWWPSSSSSSNGSSNEWEGLEAAMLSAVARLRLTVQDASCAALITCPAGLFSESFQVQLQHLADAVLALQSLADNSDVYRLLPEPTSASALLEVRRLPNLGLLRQRYSEERLYVIRMKRRTVSVGVLDLVPLEAAEGQSAGASEGTQAENKPAAAKICGSGPTGSSSKLDF